MPRLIVRAAVGSVLPFFSGVLLCTAQTVDPRPSTRLADRGATAAVGAAMTPASSAVSLSPPITWQPLGRSVDGRVIEFVQLGDGETNVLAVGPLDGRDSLGVEVAQRLAAHLIQFPAWLSGIKVTIVRDPNPDGRARRTAGNSHGVELDRNFHTQRWRKVSEKNHWISGREPESEPETRSMADLLADLKPQRIVVLASSPRQPSLGFCGPAESWARQVGNALRGAPQPIDPATAPGSLAVFAGNDQGIATVVLRIPMGLGAERAWSDCKRAMLTAVSDGSSNVAAQRPVVAPITTMSPARELAPPAASESPRREGQPRVLTYEELANSATLAPVIGRREAESQGAPAPIAGGTTPPPGVVPPPLNVVPSAPRNFVPVSSSSLLGASPLERPTTAAAPVGESNRSDDTPMRIERLPPVDRSRPPVRPRLQEPIPFYPDAQNGR